MKNTKEEDDQLYVNPYSISECGFAVICQAESLKKKYSKDQIPEDIYRFLCTLSLLQP